MRVNENLTDKQKRKLTKLANLAKEGSVAIVKHLFEVEETIEKVEEKFEKTVEKIKAEVPDLNKVLESVKGKDGDKGDKPIAGVDYPIPENGKDYILTEEDKKYIASCIEVPIVEKVIERTEVIKEQPIVKTEIVKEVTTTIDKSETATEIINKLESVEEESQKLSINAIKGWKEVVEPLKNSIKGMLAGGARYISQLFDVKLTNIQNNDVLKWNSTTNMWENGTGGGGGGHTIQDEGVDLTQRTNLNFVGSGVTVTDDAGNDATVVTIGGGGSTAWGDITGTLSDQTDLQTALDGKVDENSAITGATKTKITYDAKGLVTAGADATTADIADSSNKRYVTDAQLTVIGNTSGTNTGDQTSVTGNAGTATALQTARTIGTITGDATSAGSSFDGTANNTNALTLATVNANVGSFGSATAAPAVTVNAKGLVTAVSTNTITPAVGSITGLGTGVATALAVNVGSAGAPVVQNGALGTPSSGTITNLTGTATGATVGNALLKESIVFGVDGGGSAVTTGQVKAFRTAVYAGTITAWKITVDTGTATVKFWKVAAGTSAPTISNVINTSGVSLSSGTMIRSTTLTDFTSTTVTANDTFGCDITAISGATFITIELEITRT